MPSTKGPLRKVVGTEGRYMETKDWGRVWVGVTEVLECGHKQAEKSDIYGPTHAYRRRCQQCGKEGRA